MRVVSLQTAPLVQRAVEGELHRSLQPEQSQARMLSYGGSGELAFGTRGAG